VNTDFLFLANSRGIARNQSAIVNDTYKYVLGHAPEITKVLGPAWN